MSKPSEAELQKALRAAIEMKEQNHDVDFMAKTLLNHHYRLHYLEDVLKAADLYMNHGMSEQDQMHLLRSIEKAREAEYRTANKADEHFGLA